MNGNTLGVKCSLRIGTTLFSNIGDQRTWKVFECGIQCKSYNHPLPTIAVKILEQSSRPDGTCHLPSSSSHKKKHCRLSRNYLSTFEHGNGTVANGV